MTDHSIIANWQTPTSILIGSGRIRDVIPLLLETKVKTILIVTDLTMVHSAVLKNLLKSLERVPLSFGCFCLHHTYGNKGTLKLATHIFKSGGFDCIIGLGRAGALDLAKLIALNGKTEISETSQTIPVYTIPVGSNNGAQVSDNAFLADKNGAGQFIFDPRLRPACVILDPNLFPADSTSFLCATAMNTLSQALADWCSDDFNPAEKAIAEKAIRLVFENLPNLTKKQNDMNARIAIMSAAVMVHAKTTDKLSATAAFSQAIQTLYDVDSGLVSGVLLPHILTAKYSQLTPKIEALATLLNISDGFDGFLAAFLKLRKKAGIPAKLGLLLGKQKLKNKEKLLIESYASTYPQRIPGFITQKRTIKILNAAMSGKIQRDK